MQQNCTEDRELPGQLFSHQIFCLTEIDPMHQDKRPYVFPTGLPIHLPFLTGNKAEEVYVILHPDRFLEAVPLPFKILSDLNQIRGRKCVQSSAPFRFQYQLLKAHHTNEHCRLLFHISEESGIKTC